MSTQSLDFLWVAPDSAEWPIMWECLRARLGTLDDYDEINPHDGECWQYMGSGKDGPFLVHDFRHRNRPYGSFIDGGHMLPLPHCGRINLRLIASARYHEDHGLPLPDTCHDLCGTTLSLRIYLANREY